MLYRARAMTIQHASESSRFGTEYLKNPI